MAIVKAKQNVHSFHTIIARTMIECDAEGFSDWQCDGGFYHDEGEFNVDWSSARVVYPNEYEVIMGDKNCEGKYTIEEIVEVFEDTVLIDNADITEVE
jgi:hypothetical protein